MGRPVRYNAITGGQSTAGTRREPEHYFTPVTQWGWNPLGAYRALTQKLDLRRRGRSGAADDTLVYEATGAQPGRTCLRPYTGRATDSLLFGACGGNRSR